MEFTKEELTYIYLALNRVKGESRFTKINNAWSVLRDRIEKEID